MGLPTWGVWLLYPAEAEKETTLPKLLSTIIDTQLHAISDITHICIGGESLRRTVTLEGHVVYKSIWLHQFGRPCWFSNGSEVQICYKVKQVLWSQYNALQLDSRLFHLVIFLSAGRTEMPCIYVFLPWHIFFSFCLVTLVSMSIAVFLGFILMPGMEDRMSDIQCTNYRYLCDHIKVWKW